MSIESQYDREERQIIEDFEAGRISRSEYNAALRQLQRDARDEMRAYAEDCAQKAYDDAMGGGW